MTCIVGLVDQDTIYMGGDSAASDLYRILPVTQPKVFIRENIIFGYTSSFRMGQLLEHTLIIPRHDPSVADMSYLVGTFIDAVRRCLRDGGYLSKSNEVEAGGQFLIGYRKKLYTIHTDLSVIESGYPYASIGSGSDVATGALYALDGSPPIERVQRALEAAEAHVPTVWRPFYIKEL